MSTLSSILSSIGSKSQTPQQTSSPRTSNPPRTAENRASTFSDAQASTPRPAAAGVKRKSEELEASSKSKLAKLEDGRSFEDAAARTSGSRFQLSTKPTGPQQLSRGSVGLPSGPATPLDPRRSAPKTGSPPSSAVPKDNGSQPVKRGFASIMEKAKAAEEVAKAAGSSTIKHKAAEKLTKRDRRRIMEAAKAEQRAGKRGQAPHQGPGQKGRFQVASSDGGHGTRPTEAMRKSPVSLSYKGTMRSGSANDASIKKRKGEPQDKYGGYASWSDLDDAEDDEDDYGSDGSSDMEGGFDDVEREELHATRAARREDQEALEEEEKHRREKAERKRKLIELSQSAKARKRY